MEPNRFVDRETFYALGVQVRGNAPEMDYGDLWENQFMPRHDEIAPHSTDGNYYCVYFDIGQNPIEDVLAGMAVPADVDVPEGLVLREVPAARCAVFECTMKDIGPTWGAIIGEWLPTSGYQLVGPNYELYPPESESGDMPLQIYLPVVATG